MQRLGCLKSSGLRNIFIQQRTFFAESLYRYGQLSNYTKAIESVLTGIHDCGASWSVTIALTGFILRVLSSPTHIYAEKIYTKQTLTVGFLKRKLIERIADHYQIAVIVSNNDFKLQTTDKKLLSKCNKLVDDYVHKYLIDNRIGTSRVLNLRVSVIPVWFFASLALRNIIATESFVGMNGALWFPDLLLPDPYFLLPIGVGVLGFSNLILSQRLYRTQTQGKFQTIFFTVFTLTVTAVLLRAPSCFSLYWFIVGLTALLETQALRHPKIKKFFGILPLPTDTSRPFSNLFLRKGSSNKLLQR